VVFRLGAKKSAYINPKMLIWARGETPFSSIHDVTVRLPKLTFEQIEAWENGKEYPSINEAKALAALYDVPFACLYFTEIPSKIPCPYTDRRMGYAQIDGEISYELWLEIRRITSNREIAIDTDSDFLDIQPMPEITHDESISSVAAKIRTYLGDTTPFKYKNQYGNGAFKHFQNIFESKGIMVAQISNVSMTEMCGLSMYNDLMPIIAVNGSDWEKAKVFTLFHEMAHLLRRSSSICLIDFNELNDDEEKICDKIAAETLLPESAFRQIVSEMGKRANAAAIRTSTAVSSL
jgi:Zn-dependent peptidase ImmA (M78 family)